MKCVKSPWRHSSTVSYASVVSLAAISNTRPSFKNVCKTFLNLPCLPHILKCTKYSGYHKTCTLQIVHSKYVLFIQTSTMPKYLAGKGLSLKLNSKGIPTATCWLCKKQPPFTLFICQWRAAMPCVCDSHAGGHGTGHVLSWPLNPPHTRTSFCLFFFPSVHSLTSHLRPEGSNCATALQKKKKNSASFQPHPIPKTKCFV